MDFMLKDQATPYFRFPNKHHDLSKKKIKKKNEKVRCIL